ncbi:MAG TPA: DUF4145 domain-containing protein [Geobacteraceae bacterium]
MDNWWSLGEWSGCDGTNLAIYQISCPFCMEEGNFSTEFHATKKQPNGKKVLNFDTLKCGNCAAYVQVFWSAGDRLHSYRVQPWPLKYEKAPEQYPAAIGRFWLQAKRNLKDRNWDAAAVMARSALQLALRSNNAKGANLKQEIDDLATKGILPPIMQEWSHNVRELGNDSAHPNPDQPPTDPKDATDIVGFLDFLLEYIYTLPKKINEYRGRKDA